MAWLGHSLKWGSPSAKLEDSHSPKPVAEELAQGLLPPQLPTLGRCDLPVSALPYFVQEAKEKK